LALKIIFAVFVVGTWLFAYSTDPPRGITGGFGEPACNACHFSFPLDSGRDLGGDFFLDDVPETYAPGEVYTIAVVIQQPGQMRWGYELAVRDENGEQAGDIKPDENSQVRIGVSNGVQYLSHKEGGTFAGLEDGPAVWQFDWLAPNKSVGTVFFNAAGNAANNDGTQFDDYIYTTEAVSEPAADAGN
jgi:hypothetical protein